MKPFKSSIQWFILSLIFLISCLSLFIYWLLASHSGLLWSYQQIKSFIPGKLEIQRIEGTLADSLHLYGIHYHQPNEIDLSLKQFDLSWTLSSLLDNTLDIQQIKLNSLDVKIAQQSQTGQTNTKFNPADLTNQFPIDIKIKNFSLDFFSLGKRNSTHPDIVIDQLSLKNIEINQFFHIQQGTVKLTEQTNIPQTRLDFSYRLGFLPPYVTDLSLKWNANIKHSLTHIHPLLKQLKSSGKLELKGQLELPNFHLITNIKNSPNETISNPQLISFFNHQGDIALNFSTTELEITKADIVFPVQQGQLSLNGKGHIQASNPEGNFYLNWKNIALPINNGQQQISSRIGKAHIFGNREHYQFNFASNMQVAEQVNFDLSGSVIGEKHHLRYALQSNLLLGQSEILGILDLQNNPQWQLTFNAKQLELNPLPYQLDGKISFQLKHQGSFINQHFSGNLELDELSGNINGYPVKLKLKMKSDGVSHQLDTFSLVSAQNNIDAQGYFAPNNTEQAIKLNYKVDLANIHHLIPEAKGQLYSQGAISGIRSRLKLNTSLKAKNLGYRQWQLEDLSGRIHFNGNIESLSHSTANDNWLDLTMSMHQLSNFDDILLKQATILAKGRNQQHKIKLQLDTGHENISGKITGKLSKQIWLGKFTSLTFDSSLLGLWKLKKITPFEISALRGELKNLCIHLQNQDDQFCIKSQWQHDLSQLELKAKINHFELSRYQSMFLPKKLQLSGSAINAQLSSSVQKNSAKLNFNIIGKMKLALEEGELIRHYDGQQQHFKLHGSQLSLNINSDGLNGQLSSKFLNHSQINAHIHLPELSQWPFPQNPSVVADIKTDIEDLDLLPSFIPELDNIRGKLALKFNISNQLKKPTIIGHAHLSAATEIKPLGIELSSIKASLNSKQSNAGNIIQLEAKAQSKQGQSQLNAQFDISQWQHWFGKAHLKANNFNIIHTDDYKIWISPDIQLNIKPDKLILNGKLDIPKARITPQISVKTSTDKIYTNPDIIVVEENSVHKNTAKATNNHAILGSLDISLADDIHFSMADFNSNLNGKLKLNFTEKQAIPNAIGGINIVKGSYKAYGQDLTIDNGKINFTGGPMDNPDLDIRATRAINNRNFDGVNLAGVEIRGTAQKPKMHLFSEPLVSEADIISYLITGTALSSNSVASRELSLGKYITPSFYISVGYDLFEGQKSFNLRYDLSQRWAMEAMVGDRDSGIDFSFSLGRE